MHDGLGLRYRGLIITGHLVFGAGWLGNILVATANGETRLTQALHRLLRQLALQEVSQLHILIALEECSALSTRLHRAAVPVGLFISMLAGGADYCLVVIIAGAWENACGVEPLVGLYMRCMAGISQLDVYLGVDSVFNLGQLFGCEQSAVFLRLRKFDISMFLDKLSR